MCVRTTVKPTDPHTACSDVMQLTFLCVLQVSGPGSDGFLAAAGLMEL